MEEFVLVLVIILAAAFIVAYVQRRKRSDLPLWRAVVVFSIVFFSISAAGIALVVGAHHLLKLDARYNFAVALFLLFGFLSPAWQLATRKISPPDDAIEVGTRAYRWQTWAAALGIAVMIGLIAAALVQGYDLSAVLWIAGFFLLLAFVIGGVAWLFGRK